MSEPSSVASERVPRAATIHSHAERDRTAEAPRLLADGMVAHVGFVDGGRPVVIPMTYQYAEAAPRLLYLHGGVRGRLMAHLGTGAPVCVTVTELDGLVYSRTALNHSVNYRSVVAFARAAARQPSVAERERILAAMIARYFPNRTAGVDYAAPSAAQLEATALVALEIEEWSAKVRTGGANGPGDDDPTRPGTAGVVSLGRGAAAVRSTGAAGDFFVVRMVPGPGWKSELPMREQPGWAEHAAFMDALAAEGFIVLGGPLGGGDVKLHVVQAPGEAVIRTRLAADPWSATRQIEIWDVRPWTVLLDGRR